MQFDSFGIYSRLENWFSVKFYCTEQQQLIGNANDFLESSIYVDFDFLSTQAHIQITHAFQSLHEKTSC